MLPLLLPPLTHLINLNSKMGKLLILLLLTLPAHIFTTIIVKSSSEDELPWPPVKYTKLNFFLHTKPSPPNATEVEVVRPPNNNLPFNFGQLRVFDEPLTTGPNILSSKLGSNQGMFIFTDQNTLAGFMSMSLVFSDGLYTGSTIVLLGHYKLTSAGVDLPIVGGTGYFSYSQGVCKIRNLLGPSEPTYELDCDVYHRSPLQGRNQPLFSGGTKSIFGAK